MCRALTEAEQAAADEEFVRRLIKYLTDRVPKSAAKLTFNQLRSVVWHGVRTARSYGLENECDLAAFTFDMLAVNPQFHLQPEINAVLSDTATPHDERMPKATTASARAWVEAGRMVDAASYWQRVLDHDPGSSSLD